MHTIKVTRTGNSLDQEYEMESPDISIGDNYIAIRSMKNMSHEILVFDLNLLTIEIAPQ